MTNHHDCYAIIIGAGTSPYPSGIPLLAGEENALPEIKSPCFCRGWQ
ncbi:MAG: hypothetical protein HND47_03415 [Chloroflexi bacterium]|nr:hypothetical protein [Chloroflexota bacterium]